VAIPIDVRGEAEAALEQFCSKHSSPDGADRLRYSYAFEANAMVLLVQRPAFLNEQDWVSSPVAKFRYSGARSEWSLYWRDSTHRWQRVSNVKAAKQVTVLLQAVLTDSTGVFWS
jgi:hypothetical protein